MTDTVERLRADAASSQEGYQAVVYVQTLTEAADEIAALRDRAAEFCEAMEYAAGCDEGVDEDTAASEIMSWAGSPMAVAYTNARAILATPKGLDQSDSAV